MTNHEERAITSMRARLAALLLLRQALPALTVWAFLWGTTGLALRAALGASRVSLLWGLVTLPVALVPAIILAWRALPSRSAVRALLDQWGGCGGLLMAGEEVSLDAWRKELPLLELPALSWRGQRAWVLLGAAGAFVLFCFFVPSRLTQLLPEQRLQIDREAARLAEQIDLLAQEHALPARRAEELKKELERLRRDATGKGPAKTLEAMDHLHDTATKSGRDAAAAAAQQREGLARAAALADLLGRAHNVLGDRATMEGLSALARLTRNHSTESGLLGKGLERAVLDALRQEKGLSPQQLASLAKALEANKEMLGERGQRLYAARLIDRETLQRLEKAGQRDPAALAAYLEANSKRLSNELARGPKSGRGGLGGGTGKSELTWKHASKADGTKFKEEALPASALAGLRDIHRIATVARMPKVGGGSPAESGSLAGAKAGHGEADVPIVWPRHRDAIERYFNRSSN
jgi:hypothetical protein